MPLQPLRTQGTCYDKKPRRTRLVSGGFVHSVCAAISEPSQCFKVLIDVPRSDLAEELAQSETKIQVLQDTLQQLLDRREEQRQSRQLLELYLEALKTEDSVLSKVAGREHLYAREGGFHLLLNGINKVE